jgi:RNA ligase (TIGR02306 family)
MDAERSVIMNDIVRKLASVRRIEAVEPIEGADNIVCATVDGWKLVTQKSNNFAPGDLVLYFEIDSFLPAVEKFEFLRKSSLKVMDGVEGFRLRTIKLRGQISQGLILPLSEFADLGQMDEGYDLTEVLGVKKWEAPIHPSLYGKARGNFPEYIRKTDQERVQNVFKYFRRHDDVTEYEVTLKLDGSSMTAYCKSGYVGVCSRNLDLTETDDNSFWRVARSTKLVEALEAYGKNIAIQGELMGPGVQGNRENLKKLELYIFDVYDIDAMEYMGVAERLKVLEDLMELGAEIKSVPWVSYNRLENFNTVEDFLAYADRASINHPIAEGVVFKSMDGNRHSFKVINNKFLLKEKD